MPVQKNSGNILKAPYIYIYIYILVSWLIVVKGNSIGSFLIATALRSRGGHYSFPWITVLTLDPYLII